MAGPTPDETKNLNTAFMKFAQGTEGKALVATADSADATVQDAKIKKTNDAFVKWVTGNKTTDDAAKAAAPALAHVNEALTKTFYAEAKAAAAAASAPPPPAITPIDGSKASKAFTQFLRSEDSKTLRENTAPNKCDAKKAFAAWLDLEKNKALKAETGDISGLSDVLADDKLREIRRNTVVDKAFNAFLASPKAAELMKSPDAVTNKRVMEEFKIWVKANGEGAKPASPEAAAALSVIDDPQVNANENRFGSMFGLARKSAQKAPEPEEGIFGKNKFGFIGGIIAAILGFLIGGPMGGLLGGAVGFGLGGKFGDKQGILTTMFNPEPASPNIAKTVTRTGPDGSKSSAFLMKNDGTATQVFKDADSIIIGQFEGRGEERRFVISAIAVMDPENKANLDNRKPLSYQPASGTLSVTKGGGIDVTNENSVILTAAIEKARESANIALVADKEGLNAGLTEDLLNAKIQKQGGTGAQNNAKQALEAVQSGWEKRMAAMGVSEADRLQIAQKITEKYATAAGRTVDSKTIMEEVLATKISGDRKIEEVLQLSVNNGAGDTAMGGKNTLTIFKDAFTASSDNIKKILEDRVKTDKTKDGNIEMPAPLLPAIASSDKARREALESLEKEKARLAAANKVESVAADLKPTTKLEDIFTPLSVPLPTGTTMTVPLTMPNPMLDPMNKAVAETPGKEADKRYTTVKLGDKQVTLVGTIDATNKFVAEKMIVQTGSGITGTVATIDIKTGIGAEKRSFTTDGKKLEIKDAPDANRAMLEALLKDEKVAKQLNASAPAPAVPGGRKL